VQLDASILHSILEYSHLHHRMPSFSRLFQGCHDKLKRIFQVPDQYEIIVMGCSGTGMTEAMLRNYRALHKGTVLCLVNGHFGMRLARLCEDLGIPSVALHAEEGRNFSLSEIQRLVEEHPHIEAIAAVHMETSLGQLNELEPISGFCREKSLKFLVDMVSSFGGEDFQLASLAPSIAVTVSGKALGALPGLGFAFVDQDVIRELYQTKQTEHYFSFLHYKEARCERNEMPFTPPVHLFAALHRALELIEHETLPGKIIRHQKGIQILEDLANSWGFETFACDTPSSTTRTLVYPLNATAHFDEFHELLREQNFIPLQNRKTQRDRGHFQLSTMGHIQPTVLERLAANLQLIAQPISARGEA
jgi:2-aminoethylphosphonate-pyruvate transaminase